MIVINLLKKITTKDDHHDDDDDDDNDLDIGDDNDSASNVTKWSPSCDS